jgi:hypothetical protein
MPDVQPDAFRASRRGRGAHPELHQEPQDERQSQDGHRNQGVERREQSQDVRVLRRDHQGRLGRCAWDAWAGVRREPWRRWGANRGLQEPADGDAQK